MNNRDELIALFADIDTACTLQTRRYRMRGYHLRALEIIDELEDKLVAANERIGQAVMLAASKQIRAEIRELDEKIEKEQWTWHKRRSEGL